MADCVTLATIEGLGDLALHAAFGLGPTYGERSSPLELAGSACVVWAWNLSIVEGVHLSIAEMLGMSWQGAYLG